MACLAALGERAWPAPGPLKVPSRTGRLTVARRGLKGVFGLAEWHRRIFPTPHPGLSMMLPRSDPRFRFAKTRGLLSLPPSGGRSMDGCVAFLLFRTAGWFAR